MDDNKTYEETNTEDVVEKTGASGFDKRQSTVQITVFGDGVPASECFDKYQCDDR